MPESRDFETAVERARGVLNRALDDHLVACDTRQAALDKMQTRRDAEWSQRSDALRQREAALTAREAVLAAQEESVADLDRRVRLDRERNELYALETDEAAARHDITAEWLFELLDMCRHHTASEAQAFFGATIWASLVVTPGRPRRELPREATAPGPLVHQPRSPPPQHAPAAADGKPGARPPRPQTAPLQRTIANKPRPTSARTVDSESPSRSSSVPHAPVEMNAWFTPFRLSSRVERRGDTAMSVERSVATHVAITGQRAMRPSSAGGNNKPPAPALASPAGPLRGHAVLRAVVPTEKLLRVCFSHACAEANPTAETQHAAVLYKTKQYHVSDPVSVIAGIARVSIPSGSGAYELDVSLRDRLVTLRDAATGELVSRDGRWSLAAVGVHHDDLRVGFVVSEPCTVLDITRTLEID